ncbi:hypothetical protein AXF42_Ash010843 [Apostasia shenzhenica]|uniref:Uncharacterized protein n=1 Tax=Apostasia shenzhenica TaxID=1088818 RepID=A0A2I0A0T7_9ASPA|nr:hypothetical protein AXF42_Ash010843 [Apostasia shenzhenica]
MFNQRENLQRWTSRRTLPDSCTAVNASSWQDGISTSSLSEVEETTVGVHGHHLAGGAVDSIYEAVRSEVQRDVSEMQSDLENVSLWMALHHMIIIDLVHLMLLILSISNGYDQLSNHKTGFHVKEITMSLLWLAPSISLHDQERNHVLDFQLLASQTPFKAIWGKNYTMHSSNGNLETVELVTDIRIEYETKLKEVADCSTLKPSMKLHNLTNNLFWDENFKSHERARKLRADLAVEEQRELEISRMLKKIIPIERSTAQKSLTGRKSSVDRLHMSRRLAEDAMNYFDECVSISTFDSSDFSSVEDQQPSSVGVISHVDCAVPCTSNGNIHTHKELENENHCNSNEISSSGPMEAFESHDLRNYIKKFEKKSNESSEHIEEISRFSFDDYDLYNSAESLLQELIILRNRIESGSLLLCCNIRNF